MTDKTVPTLKEFFDDRVPKTTSDEHAAALAALKAKFGDNAHDDDVVTLAFPHPREQVDPEEWEKIQEALQKGDIERYKNALAGKTDADGDNDGSTDKD